MSQLLCRERIRAATAANTISTAKTPDKSYVREYKNFKRFVDEERARDGGSLPQDDKYITRDAVDLYFVEVVAYREQVMPETARRVVPSLQFFADSEEYADCMDTFEIESGTVTKALKAQSQRYFTWIAEQELLDPHSNLPTNVIATEEHVKVLHEIHYNSHSNWQDLCLSWTLCTSTFIRNDSARKLSLQDLVLDRGHGPALQGPHTRMLAWILRQGRHKVKKDKTRIVGAWRHKNYRQCCVGAQGMVLFDRLHHARDVNFYKNSDGIYPWRKVKLIQKWKDQKAAEKAYNRVLSAVRVSWAKVTHLRKAGMEQGSVEGELTTEELATMSKHDTKKIFRYATELYKPLLKVMSGHLRSDEYFVPRTLLEIPEQWGDIMELIFPLARVWRFQHHSPMGDKSEAAYNFLYEVLPFLALVVIQDGAFWIHDYPDHPYTRKLLSAMPADYERWACDARKLTAEKLQNREQSQVSNLNQAAQASYTQLDSRVGQVEAGVGRVDTRVGRVEKQMSQMIENQNVIIGLLANQQATIPTSHVAASPSARQPATFSFAAPVPQYPQTNVNNALRNTPKVPAIPVNLPESMMQLLNDHEKYYFLTKYKSPSTRRHWPPALKNAYSRRQYLYDTLVRRAERIRCQRTLESQKLEAAQRMDDEMKKYNIANTSQYYTFLKKNDPSTKRRKPKQV